MFEAARNGCLEIVSCAFPWAMEVGDRAIYVIGDADHANAERDITPLSHDHDF